ncbi:MAG: HIT domain-containing protein [Acidimicrobiales bacterium]|nr:HIT domain-containing protein [Acidimicrobiales bacterium]
MSQLEHLWAGWRQAYIKGETSPQSLVETPEGVSIFSAIEQSELPDEETLIIHRGETCFVLLNVYPYTTGHTMIIPLREVEALTDLTSQEYEELWQLVKKTVQSLEEAYHPDGINVGLNQGKAAGAGIPEHLHVHCLPRWSGDTNFSTTVAGARVLPESLTDTWTRLREAWNK